MSNTPSIKPTPRKTFLDPVLETAGQTGTDRTVQVLEAILSAIRNSAPRPVSPGANPNMAGPAERDHSLAYNPYTGRPY